MRVRRLFHPEPARPDASANDRLFHRLHVQMTMLEHARPRTDRL